MREPEEGEEGAEGEGGEPAAEGDSEQKTDDKDEE